MSFVKTRLYRSREGPRSNTTGVPVKGEVWVQTEAHSRSLGEKTGSAGRGQRSEHGLRRPWPHQDCGLPASGARTARFCCLGRAVCGSLRQRLGERITQVQRGNRRSTAGRGSRARRRGRCSLEDKVSAAPTGWVPTMSDNTAMTETHLTPAGGAGRGCDIPSFNKRVARGRTARRGSRGGATLCPQEFTFSCKELG